MDVLSLKPYPIRVLVFISLGLLLCERFCIWFFYSSKYVDSDQTVLWMGTHDYAAGIFHEPYFYGQDYNFMFEALLGVPFLWLGIGPEIMLPIISNVLYVLPFIVFAFLAYKKEQYAVSTIALLLPVLVTFEFAVNSGIPRGFVTGMPFLSLMVPALFNDKRLKYIVFAIIGFSFSLILNSSSLIFSLPVLFYLWIKNYKNIRFYLNSILFAFPFLIVKYLADQFYKTNSHFITHKLFGIVPSIDFWISGISNLDFILKNSAPLFWFFPWLILLFILGVSVVLISRKSYTSGFALILVFCFWIFTFSLPKIHDDGGVVVLSTARMWMAVPLLTVLSAFWLFQKVKPNAWFGLIILFISLSLFAIKWGSVHSTIDKYAVDFVSQKPIYIKELKNLREDCAELTQLLNANEAELVVGALDWDYYTPKLEFMAYGCPCLEEDFPPTLMGNYERRTWRIIEENSIKRDKIIFYGVDMRIYNKLDDSLKMLEIISENPRLLSLELSNRFPLQAANDLGFFHRPSDSVLLQMKLAQK